MCEAFGCEMRAKSSTMATVIPTALKTGNCELRPESYVRKIATNGSGKLTGAIYFDRENREIFQRAKAVAVCANGAETPRLLLMSASKDFPNGLANSSGMAGKHLMFDAGPIVSGVFEHPLNEFKSIQVTRVLHDFYESDPKRGFYGGGGLDARFDYYPISFGLEGLPGDVPRWGSTYKKTLGEYFTRTMSILAHSSCLSRESNSISLDPDVKDAWGLPALRVTFDPHPDDGKAVEFLLKHMFELMDAAGAKKAWEGPMPLLPSRHLMGSCRMGNDPKTSVVNSENRAHDVPNLYIVDGERAWSRQPASNPPPLFKPWPIEPRIISSGRTVSNTQFFTNPLHLRKGGLAYWLAEGTMRVYCFSAFLMWGCVAAQTLPTGSIFQVVKTPNDQPFQNQLLRAAASSPTDIWAVGQATIHYDGTKWTAFHAPMVKGDNTSYLNGLVDISPTEAWAGGNINVGEVNPGQIIERWDGTQWSVFPGPAFGSNEQPSLYGMTAVAANDIWAVGALLVDNEFLYELFEHWDGTAWTATTGNFNGFFNAVSADASNDIWAVGCGNFSERYDGTKWSYVAVPNVGTGTNCLNAVVALAPNDVWAAGYSTATAQPPPHQYDVPTTTLIEHWDGSKWTVIPSPSVGPKTQYESNRLLGIVAVSSTDLWAFGSYFAASGSENQMTLILHWDGTQWSLTPSPNPNSGDFLADILFGGVATGGGNVWLVGSEDKPPGAVTLVLHTTGG